MKALKILSVVGARPNFVKIAPFIRAIEDHNLVSQEQDSRVIEHYLVHTGQHYDDGLSRVFFDSLHIPFPDVNLDVGSGTHAEQVGRTMIALEPVLRQWRPDWVVVVGDVNATCAGSITAKKEGVSVAHIEAGLRSFDMQMPEEINRVVTDRLSDLLFTPDTIADQNLLNEGVSSDKIRRVGNIMIDTLDASIEQARKLDLDEILRGKILDGHNQTGIRFEPDAFSILTLHRPANVDDEATLAGLVDVFCSDAFDEKPLVWTLHPRARKQLEKFNLWDRVVNAKNVVLINPLNYLEMLKLNMTARVALTDSGGLQEECCVLGTPCITLRDTTERPVTLRQHGGVSELVSSDPALITSLLEEFTNIQRRPHRPPMWDGKTATRIVAEMISVSFESTSSTPAR